MNWITGIEAPSMVPAPPNDPRLFEMIKVRALRPFCVRGRRIEIGEAVHVERHVAESLAAVGRCKFV